MLQIRPHACTEQVIQSELRSRNKNANVFAAIDGLRDGCVLFTVECLRFADTEGEGEGEGAGSGNSVHLSAPGPSTESNGIGEDSEVASSIMSGLPALVLEGLRPELRAKIRKVQMIRGHGSPATPSARTEEALQVTRVTRQGTRRT